MCLCRKKAGEGRAVANSCIISKEGGGGGGGGG